ncbi:metal ABC transporter permease [Streptomyces sp. VNUA116]|uniref:metal ABC transporter permease n=1 Tax=Streptomyces sp. VNUA116 TaxID=3062449 RepID=UPI002674B7A5|nr:metal ABC transporter permease [Streptomyces sp. VNUA116]WKU48744.1 metal ABC transporter permease [Streptomyces sp. VNUA116]
MGDRETRGVTVRLEFKGDPGFAVRPVLAGTGPGQGQPARLVDIGAAEATQAVGSLLLLCLLAAPAGAAIRLTARPYRALALSVGLAVTEMRAGLFASYAVPWMPPSFAIMATATAVYAATLLIRRPAPRTG